MVSTYSFLTLLNSSTSTIVFITLVGLKDKIFPLNKHTLVITQQFKPDFCIITIAEIPTSSKIISNDAGLRGGGQDILLIYTPLLNSTTSNPTFATTVIVDFLHLFHGHHQSPSRSSRYFIFTRFIFKIALPRFDLNIRSKNGN